MKVLTEKNKQENKLLCHFHSLAKIKNKVQKLAVLIDDEMSKTKAKVLELRKIKSNGKTET